MHSKTILLAALVLSLFLSACHKCYYCNNGPNGNYNGDVCSNDADYKYIKADTGGLYIYSGPNGQYFCTPQ